MAATSDSTSSTDRAAADRSPRVVVGRVSGAHGLAGNLSVRTFGDPDHLPGSQTIWLSLAQDAADAEAYDVERVFGGRRGEVRVSLVGVEDRTAAEGLRGRWVSIETDQFDDLPAGEFYHYQLVGCSVEAEDGRVIGTVTEIWSTGAPDVLIVDDGNGRQHLIPAAQGLLREVDVDARRIVVEILPGLLGDDGGS